MFPARFLHECFLQQLLFVELKLETGCLCSDSRVVRELWLISKGHCS